MPIYEYECKACGAVQELMQKMDEPPPPHCAKCAEGPLVKLMSRTAYVLKGSGWYVSDFRGGNKGGADKKSDDKSSGDTSAAADAKPATSEKKDTPSGGDSGGSGGMKASGHACGSGCGH